MIHKMLLPSARTAVADFTKPLSHVYEHEQILINYKTGLITFHNGRTLFVDQLLEFIKAVRIVRDVDIQLQAVMRLDTLLEFFCDGNGIDAITIAGIKCDIEYTCGGWADNMMVMFGRMQYLR